MGYRQGIRLAAMALVWGAVSVEAGVAFIPSWSPRNKDRPIRKSTLYIVLHTTEGPARGSLQKLRDNGEAHFFVDPTGALYAIIDRRRVALHAGRSMWRGRTNIDDVSIGIEVSGYYYQNLTAAQFTALRALLTELQAQYGVPDDRVLTHSMVAYGAPNRWHRRSHRGRKRCGMLFAAPDVRQRLGLSAQPSYDPDVRAGRLDVGDTYLAQKLYGRAPEPKVGPATTPAAGTAAATRPPPPVAPAAPVSVPGAVMVITDNRSAWDVARDQYDDPGTRYIFPDGKETRGDRIRNWKAIPPGTRVVLAGGEGENSADRMQQLGVDGATAQELAGEEYRTARTIYFLKDGRIRTGAELSAGELASLPAGTGLLVGYTLGGSISAKRRAFDVCGVKWNDPATYYRLPDGRMLSGADLQENAIPEGTQVFFTD